MEKEELLYNIIFQKDVDPYYVNYCYFKGSCKKSIYKLKATINESDLNPILICDGNVENAFFAKVFESEIDRFLKIVDELNFKQIKISSRYRNEVKLMFRAEIMNHQKKVYKTSENINPLSFNKKVSNW